tara:strand:- start:467 stop:685 length:219 start_codon:yes stop_codon:yes gene_type:complete
MQNPQLKNSYHKTISAIESCTTTEHLLGAYSMVNNFKVLYGEVGYPKVLSYNLDREFRIKEKYILGSLGNKK